MKILQQRINRRTFLLAAGCLSATFSLHVNSGQASIAQPQQATMLGGYGVGPYGKEAYPAKVESSIYLPMITKGG